MSWSCATWDPSSVSDVWYNFVMFLVIKWGEAIFLLKSLEDNLVSPSVKGREGSRLKMQIIINPYRQYLPLNTLKGAGDNSIISLENGG